MGGWKLEILRACGVAFGILRWATAASAQFTAESLSDDDITQAIALLIDLSFALLDRPWFNVHGYSTDSARLILRELIHGKPQE